MLAVTVGCGALCSLSRADYYVSDIATTDTTFSGAGCGRWPMGRFHIPAKAIDIRPVSPSIGDPLQDGVFGEATVAQITTVTTTRTTSGTFQVTWTAVGTDAACDPSTESSIGWTTDTVTLDADYSRDVGSRVFWRSMRNRPEDQTRPRWHSVLADARFERRRSKT